MPLPVRSSLPVVQNWDCHQSGSCCKEYQVAVTDEERQRIEAQGWASLPDFQGVPLFTAHGPPWARQHHLNHRPDGSCVFLSPEGRCRIHERFGAAAKPLPCRLFPFLLVPAGDHYRVGVRFACPSAAENKGRALSAHDGDLRDFAAQLERREGVARPGAARTIPPPALQKAQVVDWPDLLRFIDALQRLLRNHADRVDRRLRKCLHFANLCRQAKFDKVSGPRLVELLDLLAAGLEGEVPADAASLPRPGWSGRLLFRQALALYARKDRGPNRGPATFGRLSLLRAAWRYGRGRGEAPRLHGWSPHVTFEKAEEPAGPLPADAEALLERYYLIKVGSLQFCGVTNFGMPVWEGLESLLLTFPILMWLRRGLADRNATAALARALSIVDDNFGYHPALGAGRQRFALRILAGTGELERLIAWYSR
jgi:lysine-N-methylase